MLSFVFIVVCRIHQTQKQKESTSSYYTCNSSVGNRTSSRCDCSQLNANLSLRNLNKERNCDNCKVPLVSAKEPRISKNFYLDLFLLIQLFPFLFSFREEQGEYCSTWFVKVSVDENALWTTFERERRLRYIINPFE